MGYNECDDGNNSNNDGCDANCKIEEFFECTGGNAHGPDTCRKTLKPKIEQLKYFGNTTAVLRFSEKVKIKSKNFLFTYNHTYIFILKAFLYDIITKHNVL